MKLNEGNFITATLEVGLTPVELVMIRMALDDFPEKFDDIKEKLGNHMNSPIPVSDEMAGNFKEVTAHLMTGTKMFLDSKIYNALNLFIDNIDLTNGTFLDNDDSSKPIKLPAELELKILEDLLNNTDFGENIAQMAEIDPDINAAVMADGQMFDLGTLKNILSHIDDNEYTEIDDHE